MAVIKPLTKRQVKRITFKENSTQLKMSRPILTRSVNFQTSKDVDNFDRLSTDNFNKSGFGRRTSVINFIQTKLASKTDLDESVSTIIITDSSIEDRSVEVNNDRNTEVNDPIVVTEYENGDEVTKEEVTNDKVTIDEVTGEEVTEEEVTDDNITIEEVTGDEVNKEEVIDDKVTIEEVTGDEVNKEEVTDDKVTIEEVTDDEVIREVTDDKVTIEEVTGDEVIGEVTDDKVTEEEFTGDKVTGEEVIREVTEDNVTEAKVTEEVNQEVTDSETVTMGIVNVNEVVEEKVKIGKYFIDRKNVVIVNNNTRGLNGVVDISCNDESSEEFESITSDDDSSEEFEGENELITRGQARDLVSKLVSILNLIKLSITFDSRSGNLVSENTKINIQLFCFNLKKTKGIEFCENKDSALEAFTINYQIENGEPMQTHKILLNNCNNLSLFKLVNCNKYPVSHSKINPHIQVIEQIICSLLATGLAVEKKNVLFNTNLGELRSSLNTAICLLTILENQICADAERGKISVLVQKTAIQTFNFIVRNKYLTVYDSCDQLISGNKYDGSYSMDASKFGIQVDSGDGEYFCLGAERVLVGNPKCYISLDFLTVSGQKYLVQNLHQICDTTTFSNGICKLKVFYRYLMNIFEC